jgi:hypothetical protein
MKREAGVACVVWCLLGCGAVAGPEQDATPDGAALAPSNESSQARGERRICDGSAGIRLAVGYWGGGMPYPYTSVLSELGYDFLYVDGNCHYWVHAPLSVADEHYLWRPYREGTLTPADEQRLHDAVSYDGIPPERCLPEIPPPDAGQAFLWDGRELRSCANDGFEGSGPVRAELYDVATAVTGPMRIQVGKDSYPDPSIVYEWPLAAPIEQFVANYGETSSFRVDDLAAVTALRSLREQAIADAEASSGRFLVIAIGLHEGNERYFMSVRDELPFVDADGAWLPDP